MAFDLQSPECRSAFVGGAVEETTRRAMQAEIERLGSAGLVARRGSIDVVLARGSEIPALLREVGRQREIAFRAVGEGTGAEIDLDAFDPSYGQFIAWDREREAVVGGYRVRATSIGRRWASPQSLYSHTLFDYDAEWLRSLGPALELGRAFVAPDYQRSSWVLPLLWRSIGRWVSEHPRYRTLFGPVSLPATMPDPVRRHVVSRLQAWLGDASLAAGVRARIPFAGLSAVAPRIDPASVGREALLDALADEVARLAPEGRRLPVLLREYAKLGGVYVGFNLDPDFAQAVDALVVVRLDRAPARSLRAYMGRTGAGDFARGRAESWSIAS
ncbi:MAG: GNAT family N-acetyltransferase [Spirochaetaceae bacterium]|nr:GNAT family N-acetyltransferase [Spirochaetaceae bacterium]HPG26565.1 GNAT family N-acyltransferase [Myxococcota bacterium]